jgi:hypothetical protein
VRRPDFHGPGHRIGALFVLAFLAGSCSDGVEYGLPPLVAGCSTAADCSFAGPGFICVDGGCTTATCQCDEDCPKGLGCYLAVTAVGECVATFPLSPCLLEDGGDAGNIDAGNEDGGVEDGGALDGGGRDGGSLDGGELDGGQEDGGKLDGGNKEDGGTSDGGKEDGGSADGGKEDGGKEDAGKSDGGKEDGGEDAGHPDGGKDAG